MEMLSLRGFPRVVEPGLQVIELQARRQQELNELLPGQPGTWSHLYRISPNMLKSLPKSETATHFFGDNMAFAHCTFFVCYDASGCLDSLIIYDNRKRKYFLTEFPEEVTGRAIKKNPSVRLVFRTRKDMENFIRSIEGSPPDGLVEPPRQLDVGKLDNE